MTRCNKTTPAVLKALVALFAALCIALMQPVHAHAALNGSDANVLDPTQRADNSFIYDTTVASLFSQASLYNNKIVQVVGEVIGDRIVSDTPNSYWITLTETTREDKSTISVLLSAGQADQIDAFGRYGVVGTTLQVRGTYHQACDEHDGLPDIHVTNASVLSPGEITPDEFSFSEFIPGIVAVLLGMGLLLLFGYARERTR